MRYIRKAQDRGKADFGWLQSQHSFSFGRYYDPAHMGFGNLRVINDDTVLGGHGFDTHGHRDMEIISYVIDGELAHQDSMGNQFTVAAGEVQRMSAGSGILHSEYNASKTAPAHFLQIWIEPKLKGITPSYEQIQIKQSSALTPIVTPIGVEGTLSINAEAEIHRLQLHQGQQIELNAHAQKAYLHIVGGEATLDGEGFQQGDGIGLIAGDNMQVTAVTDVEALWFLLLNY
ncbi:pirin family protein [Pseudoalteromonas piscicida]